MKRRDVITLLGGAAAWPLAARAQHSARPTRVAYLGGTSGAGGQALAECLRKGLRDLGWIEGRNINIEYRWAEGILERYASLGEELVGSNPDLIIATSTPAAQAVQHATSRIPVVFVAVSDPVASKIVSTLARPGANVTGVSNFLPATTGKLLELLKTVAPHVSRMAILHNPSNHGKLLELRELEAAAQTLDVAVEPVPVLASDELERAVATIVQSRCDGLVTLQESVTLANRLPIVQFAERNRLPAIYQIKEFVEAGGLISYGLSYCQHFRRAAVYVDRILKGA